MTKNILFIWLKKVPWALYFFPVKLATFHRLFLLSPKIVNTSSITQKIKIGKMIFHSFHQHIAHLSWIPLHGTGLKRYFYNPFCSLLARIEFVQNNESWRRKCFVQSPRNLYINTRGRSFAPGFMRNYYLWAALLPCFIWNYFFLSVIKHNISNTLVRVDACVCVCTHVCSCVYLLADIYAHLLS